MTARRGWWEGGEVGEWLAWDVAWREALYGENGFYRRPEGPAGHFRTATHAGPDVLADALVRLAQRHGCTAVVDLGSGRGELLTALLGRGLRLHGVDVVPRPASLAVGIGWSAGLDAVPPTAFDQALVVAWELLDTVPCPVLERDQGGEVRVTVTDPHSGLERPGEPPGPADRQWCEQWWPVGAEHGSRAEVGAPRDALWGEVVRAALRGGARLLLAVDYAHTLADRPALGTLAGYRTGRLVPPVADGSCDVTAHVALDAVAAAGEQAGAQTVARTTQREALRELGIRGHVTPGQGAGPTAEPAIGGAALAALARAGREAELLDPDGLGGFGWLVQQAVPDTSA